MLIVGGGLRGCLAALALAARRPAQPFLLIDQGARFGGGDIPPFFLDGLGEGARRLLDSLIAGQWDGYYAATPDGSSARAGGTAWIAPEQLHAEITERLPPEQYRLGSSYAGFDGTRAVMADGSVVEAAFVLDARPDARGAGAGWCQIVTRLFDFERPHGLDRPVLVDATLALPGWSFLQYFPLGPARLMIRYLRHSASRRLVPLGDGSGIGDAGVLIEQLLGFFALGGRSVVDARAGRDLPYARTPVAVELNPLLPSPVPAAAAFALDFAGMPMARPATLAAALFRHQARHFGRSGTDAIVEALCGGDDASRLAALRDIAGMAPATVAALGKSRLRPTGETVDR